MLVLLPFHYFFFFFLMIRRPPRSTLSSSSAASDVYKRQVSTQSTGVSICAMRGLSVDEVSGMVVLHSCAVIDGGFATEVVARGVDVDSDSLWSASCLLNNPELIQEVHLGFYQAGADVAISASYQASFEGFGSRGCDEAKAAELMRLSVSLACAARDEFAQSEAGMTRRRPMVAASVGPYGAILHDGSEYTGVYNKGRDKLVQWHLPRMRVLANAGADFLAIETIPSLVEVEAMLQALCTVNQDPNPSPYPT
eukprot:TRINITY_DN9656_c0_g1_i6.p1 TRINITY_DN9656_c0_g1~~TRINITY_DN9656_c0_g1_i6.p1  ORF type:complete len:253 (-),score=75.77 TRINITY_DN9656_c0_g1_i6:211-969(-)